jgi:hypothetical protein
MSRRYSKVLPAPCRPDRSAAATGARLSEPRQAFIHWTRMTTRDSESRAPGLVDCRSTTCAIGSLPSGFPSPP